MSITKFEPPKHPELNSRMKHLAKPNHQLSAREEELVTLIKTSSKRLNDPEFSVPVRNLGLALCVLEKMAEHFEEVGVADDSGEIRQSVKHFYMGINSVNKICTSLGMTPTAQARMRALLQNVERPTLDLSSIRGVDDDERDSTSEDPE